MTVKAWVLVLGVALSCVALGTYFGGERSGFVATDSASIATAAIDADVEPPLHPAQADMDVAASPVEASAGARAMTDTFAQLNTDIESDDAAVRGAAIDALATLPNKQALPILQKILGEGRQEDRQLAVNVLHILAMEQGDAGGEIRDMLRGAIYDGGDESIVADAQQALESIDRDIASVAAQRSR